MEIVFVILFLSGLLFIIISIPLINKKVKINNWYGVRLPNTVNNENVWYETNRIGGIYLLRLGIIICILSIILYFQNVIPLIYSVIIISIIILIGTIFIAIKSSLVANKMSKEI